VNPIPTNDPLGGGVTDRLGGLDVRARDLPVWDGSASAGSVRAGFAEGPGSVHVSSDAAGRVSWRVTPGGRPDRVGLNMAAAAGAASEFGVGPLESLAGFAGFPNLPPLWLLAAAGGLLFLVSRK